MNISSAAHPDRSDRPCRSYGSDRSRPILRPAFLGFVFAVTALAGTAAHWSNRADARPAPAPVRGGQTVAASIPAANDTDEYTIELFAGDRLTTTVKPRAPQKTLRATLALRDPSGADAAPSVRGQGTPKPKFTHTATATGAHIVSVRGADQGQLGQSGDYQVTFAVARTAPAPVTFADLAGGPISLAFDAIDGAAIDVTAVTKKGGFDLTGLRRPDGSDDPDFAAAVQAAANRRKSTVKRFALTGGKGTYTLLGAYDATSSVKVSLKVDSRESKARRLFGEEPDFDLLSAPSPSVGIAGTVTRFRVFRVPLIEDESGTPVYPRFYFGGIEAPAAGVTRPDSATFAITAPAGLVVGQTYDLSFTTFDGQSAVLDDAFFVPPPPSAVSFSPVEGGPAGGRLVRVTGSAFRADDTVRFGTQTGTRVNTSATTIDVRAPANVPGDVTLTVVDPEGRTSSPAGTYRYLDIGSNRLFSASPAPAQGIGGETVVVNGESFGPDSVFTMDARDVSAVRLSSSQWSFAMPPHAAGSAQLRVIDQYEQTSSLSLAVSGFSDDSNAAIPVPATGATSSDGWRASRVLAGDVNGDGRTDLVLLRAAGAFGSSSGRSRIRILRRTATHTFEDRTASDLPAVSGDEDWRAKDGALFDMDGDGDLDLAIVTDETLAVTGRPSLRILRNDGTGAFTDRTATAVPANTSYGDIGQGVAIAAIRVNADTSTDLVLLHTSSFTESTSVETDPGDPLAVPPIPPTVVTTVTTHAGVRVLLNNGAGVFARSPSSGPAVNASDVSQLQGDAMAAADIDGDLDFDLVVARANVIEKPVGTYFRSAHVLVNTAGVFSDASSSRLPAAADPDYLQASRIVIADGDANGTPDLFLVLPTPLTSPGTGIASSASSLRFLPNSGGSFSRPVSPVFPAAVESDVHQGSGLAVGDLNGDGAADLYVIATSAPSGTSYAGRALIRSGSAWIRASAGMPDPFAVDDGRGLDCLFLDRNADGDLDIVIVRDEPAETVRNTRIFGNPRQ